MPSERLHFRDIRSTSAFRLTALLGAVFLAGVIAILALISLLTARELTRRSDRILFERAAILRATSPALLPERMRAEIANAGPDFSYFALLDRQGHRIVGNLAIAGVSPPGQPFNASIVGIGGDTRPLRVLATPTPQGETILLGRDISQIRSLRQRIFNIVLGTGGIGLAAMLTAAVVLSLHPLRRVRDLRRASFAIAAGKLETRMPISGRNDELDQIAATVNQMIGEVARVLAQVKATSDTIAHDLRTPLTRIRARLHHVARLPELAPEPAALVGQAIDDLDELLARFAALLRISELEASARRSGLAPVAPEALLTAVAQLYAPLAEEAGKAWTLDLQPAPMIEADEKLLFEAVSNLVDNAIKFAASRIHLRVGSVAGYGFLEVIDDGPGIAPAERDAVLLRFHRSPQAAAVPGSGLGLSVVAAILHLHNFTLELDDATPGLIARIRL